MRVFVAISPPTEIVSKISELINVLHKDFPLVKWENSEKLHLTLAFLGMLAEEKVNTLKDVLRETAPKFRTFELEIGELSYFYKKHDDSIIYLDVIEKNGEFRNFYRTLRKALLERDIFLPERLDLHITIGRVKRVRHVHVVKDILVNVARKQIPPVGTFNVSSIGVYHSMFSKEGRTSNYRLLHSSPLDTGL